MNHKHTPGPWKKVENKNAFLIKTKDGCVIASVAKFPESAPMASDQDGNAALIHKAEEMYALIRDIKSEVFGDTNGVHVMPLRIPEKFGPRITKLLKSIEWDAK